MRLAIIDVWSHATPPHGFTTDDALISFARLCASSFEGPAIVVGDAGAPRVAQQHGIELVAHVAVSPKLPALGHRRLARLLTDLGRPECIATSPVARRFALHAGAILTEPENHAPAQLENQKPLETIATERPRIVPIADHPSSIPADRLVTAAGLLQSAGTECEVVVPRRSLRFRIARARATNADRRVRVLATDEPAIDALPTAACVVSFGADADGPQCSDAARLGIPVIPADDRLSPLSLAIAIRAVLAPRAVGSA